jgi:chorismate mutase
VDLKGLPSTVDGILSIVKTSLQDLFSQHEVTNGTNKSDIRSGEMVSLLREQDSIGVVGTHAIFEESLEATMKRVLKRIQAGYTSERMIKIRGQEGDFEVISFKGADLRNNTDVHVVKQSSLSDSRVAREAQIIGKFQAGLYGDPADPEVRRHVMRMLEDAVVKDIYSDTIADETYARFENRLISESKGAEMHLVNPYDNHSIHLKEHTHFQKSMEYQKAKLGQGAKEWMMVELAFREHTSLHQKFVAEAEAAQLQKMAMLKGGTA